MDINEQKSENKMSGSEMARTKEAVAAKMREKQAAGKTETAEGRDC
jgi:hypothetical protein